MASQPAPFWLDRPAAPAPREPLRGDAACDLAVIGGGVSGLWTALLAKEGHPGRSVVLVEGNRSGWAASGRNGGFCEASLTHGADNGRERFPAEFGTLQRLGAETLDAIEPATGRYGIDCDFERAGSITVATEDYQVGWLREAAAADGSMFLDAEAVRAEVNSPTYLAGLWDKEGSAGVQPARLAWGLADACERIGVRIAERTPATGLASDEDGVTVRARHGALRARRGALRHNAVPPTGPRRAQRRGGRDGAAPPRRAAGQTGGARHQRVSPAGPAAAPVHRAGLRLRAGDRAAQPGAARRRRLAEPAGRRRRGQPVPLLPADVRQPDPVGRLRRHLPLRRRGPPGLRPAPGHLRQARRAFLHHVPAAGGHRVQPSLGWRDRYVQPVLRVLRHRAPRPGRLRARLHRAGGGRDEVRRPGDARPAERSADRADPARDGPEQAGPLPARAARLPGRAGHPLVAGPGGPPVPPQGPVAAGAGRGGHGLRLLRCAVTGRMACQTPRAGWAR